MSMKRRGFTLVEVSLFLAVTGLLFIGIMIGTQNSIWQHRYTDSVQNFTDFWRNIYAETINPQNFTSSDNVGTSERAIYGKLVVFAADGDSNKVNTYTVTGKAECKGSEVPEENCKGADTLVGKLATMGMMVGSGNDGLVTEEYKPKWGSKIKDTEGNLYQGAVLVVRHPETGTVNTLAYSGGVLDLSKFGESETLALFGYAEVDFCLKPEGGSVLDSMPARDIRLVKNARNAAGIELINLDSADNKCKGTE